jgi:hypothetical protein
MGRSRFFHPDTRLSPEEVNRLRLQGIIPVEDEKGETTRYVPVRLDSETLKQLRLRKLKLKQRGKKRVSDSEVLRYVLVQGLNVLDKADKEALLVSAIISQKDKEVEASQELNQHHQLKEHQQQKEHQQPPQVQS